MHTDKLYMVKDRFNEKLLNEVYRFNPIHARHKEFDLIFDLAKHAHGGRIPCRRAKGLETLDGLDKVYFLKRLEMYQDDIFNDYKGEFVDNDGHRLFLVSSVIQHASYEVIQFGNDKENALLGKINYGVINNDGHQLFEIHGDRQRSIRAGQTSSIWGEIQVIPNKRWTRVGCCCTNREDEIAELRAVITKRDTRGFLPPGQLLPKEVYALRGHISSGCHCQDSQNFLFKKSFDLDIYAFDPFANKSEIDESAADGTDNNGNEGAEVSDTGDEEETSKPEAMKNQRPKTKKRQKKRVKVKKNKSGTKKADVGPRSKRVSGGPRRKDSYTGKSPIGKICSQDFHRKLRLHLPCIQFPVDMNVYDKLTLMTTFFLFGMKI